MYSLICERSLFYSHKVGKVACGVCVPCVGARTQQTAADRAD